MGTITVNDISGAAALIAAAFLLVTAIRLERVARGSAIAENISFVVAACVCLGASVLGRWVVRLVPSTVTMQQLALSSDALSLVGITLLSVYFLRVRYALKRFLDIASGDEAALAMAEAGVEPVESATSEAIDG